MTAEYLAVLIRFVGVYLWVFLWTCRPGVTRVVCVDTSPCVFVMYAPTESGTVGALCYKSNLCNSIMYTEDKVKFSIQYISALFSVNFYMGKWYHRFGKLQISILIEIYFCVILEWITNLGYLIHRLSLFWLPTPSWHWQLSLREKTVQYQSSRLFKYIQQIAVAE